MGGGKGRGQKSSEKKVYVIQVPILLSPDGGEQGWKHRHNLEERKGAWGKVGGGFDLPKEYLEKRGRYFAKRTRSDVDGWD